MNLKEFAIRLMTTYFTLVTMITAAILVMGLYYEPDAGFGYEAFAVPLIYGICGTLPGIVLYSKRELTAKEFLIRKAIQFLLIEAAVLSVAFGSAGIHGKPPKLLAGIGVCVLIIFVLAHGIEWLQDCILARRLTEEFLTFQKNVK